MTRLDRLTKEKMATILEGAQDMAQNWMRDTIKAAKSNEQVFEGIVFLQLAAQHIIATAYFNAEMAQKADGDKMIDALAVHLKEELQRMRLAGDAGHLTHVPIPHDA